MYKWPNDIKQIVGSVLNSQNPVRCLEEYIDNTSAQDITFLLFDGNQTTSFSNVTHKYSQNKYRIVNLGNYNNTAVINTSILSAKQNLIPLKTSYVINLDSNIASLLPKIIKDSPIENDFLNFLKYIKSNNLNLSLSPYLLEDSLNSSGMKNNSRAYECLLGYFVFDRISLNELISLPSVPNVDDFFYADRAWSQMRFSRFYERDEEKRVRSIYCFLLKVYTINAKSNKGPKNKISELISFINFDLGVYFEFGMLLAYWYFSKTHECVIQFFQKIQPKSNDKLKNIEGMAWDLFHLWDIPTEMAILSNENNAIMLHALATHDDSLAKITKLNPITRIAFYSNKAQVKYQLSLDDVLNDSSMLDSIYDYKSQRETLCETINLLDLSTQLEQEFIESFEK